MTGTRLTDSFDELPGFKWTDMVPGSYWKQSNGTWSCKTPNGRIGSLAGHTVVEHEDGTITVSPSILVEERGTPPRPSWHGYLERGVWREC